MHIVMTINVFTLGRHLVANRRLFGQLARNDALAPEAPRPAPSDIPWANEDHADFDEAMGDSELFDFDWVARHVVRQAGRPLHADAAVKQPGRLEPCTVGTTSA